MNIAVIGTGISGLGCAWLLDRGHRVTLYEKGDYLGGHSNTVNVENGAQAVPVDTGFIVYNEKNYPNLVSLFDVLGVETVETNMSFAASLDSGAFEYSGSGFKGLFAQRRNLLNPRLWIMLADIMRFYRAAPGVIGREQYADMMLAEYIRAQRYSRAFVRDHLLPMGAAIWSTPAQDMLGFPIGSFVNFMDNHGLLSTRNRPVWRTVRGGSREYVNRMMSSFGGNIRTNTAVRNVSRTTRGVVVEDRQGGTETYDHVVIATHADQALGMLTDAEPAEHRLLSRFRYERNLAVLHTDSTLMPRTRRAWSSWNFLSEGRGREQKVCVTYWMNRLQKLPTDQQIFVTLNPVHPPAEGTVLRSFIYEHPLFDLGSIRAQRLLWNIQGLRRTWFCGSYFGHGFHEDGLQAGLAVAEQLGGLRRPWHLENPNSRIACLGNRVPERDHVEAA